MTNSHEARTAISALEALTADVLKGNDDATLDRLQELAEQCGERIEGEKGRRNPTQSFGASEFLKIARETAAKRAARQEARRATLREAIGYCDANPALRARLMAITEDGGNQ